jgi:2-methylcitrate dehydratase PrpD
VRLEEYADETIMDADIQALLPITRKEYVEKMESEFPTEVHVTLRDGSTMSTSVTMPVGSAAAPLTQDQLWAKFDDCAKSHLPENTLTCIKDMLAKLDDNQSIRSLMTGLGSPDNLKSGN